MALFVFVELIKKRLFFFDLDFYKNAGISLYETLWDNDYEGYKKFRKISLPANPSAALDKTDC